jgi:phosphatidylinositol glycan class O
LRRHLMVWNVFAPRFMLGGITLLGVDISLLLAVGVGLRVTSWKVWKTFKCESI